MGGIAAVGTAGIYVAYIDYAPLTHRRRWIATDPRFEKQLGDQNYQQLISQQFRGKVLPRQYPESRLIERIGRGIFAAAGEFATQNGLQFFDTKDVTFTVVDSEQANAFVLPGELSSRNVAVSMHRVLWMFRKDDVTRHSQRSATCLFQVITFSF